MNASSLRDHTSKELGQMAKRQGVPGWHTMRKDQLIKALLRVAKAKSKTVRSGSKSGAKKNKESGRAKLVLKNGRRSSKHQPVAKKTPPRVKAQIQKVNAERRHLKDLAGRKHSSSRQNGRLKKDRAVLMVRDPYWLHVYWEIMRTTVERVRAAMAEHWHSAKPTLRLLELENDGTTNTTEHVARDIVVHGGVNNWYIDVQDPPKKYRVAIGYLAEDGRFCSLVRSNVVETPPAGSSDAIDNNWTDVAQNYEKIYALSGGYNEEIGNGELRELFEERLRRPMGSPLVTRYGVGAQGINGRDHDFEFEVDAEMIVYGSTRPDSYVTISGEPVKLRQDGSFTVRLNMPDKRQVLPIVASSSDGVEQRTVVLAIDRNTKVMEPRFRDSGE